MNFISTAKNEGATILYGGVCPSYGLGTAVISKDLERCEHLTKALQAGIVWVNCSQPCFNQAPWGGNKRGGIGSELGEWGLDNYLSVKQVTHYISNEPRGWYHPPQSSKEL
ncbi:hypothetical protein CMV_028931 [Castanea mollissima]|uniref:Aldehyde dehydrogenase domain-containing protein n=1 Tax=Castanea mollissima TaxID=60419 RepID=A0A8J4Q6P4_9ROSI|nr:hypothetical protein CMV_028931 [Castanea mollissima]